MSYRACLRRNSDGEVRVCEYPFDYIDFVWTQGNWSCDCNRELDFYRAKNEDPPQHADPSLCLGHGAFTVMSIETHKGESFFPDEVSDDACFPDDSVLDFSTLKSGETRSIEMESHEWGPRSSTGVFTCKKCKKERQ